MNADFEPASESASTDGALSLVGTAAVASSSGTLATAVGTIAALEALIVRAGRYAEGSRAPSTRRAYAADWRAFARFCDLHGLAPLPAEPATLATWLADLAAAVDDGRNARPEALATPQARRTPYAIATIARRIASIREAHRAAGYENPFADARVRDVWIGIRRERGVAQRGRDPLELAELRRVVDRLPPTTIGRRDRALLVLGFAGAFRRSELVALDVADVRLVAHGLEIMIRRPKPTRKAARASSVCRTARVSRPVPCGPYARGWTRRASSRAPSSASAIVEGVAAAKAAEPLVDGLPTDAKSTRDGGDGVAGEDAGDDFRPYDRSRAGLWVKIHVGSASLRWL